MVKNEKTSVGGDVTPARAPTEIQDACALAVA